MTGSQAMVKCLENEGISVVFGYPGVAICPFYDSLLDSEVSHVLVRAEQMAGHAASGYARVTGKPAVCVATSGPGATNLITALATAYMDSIPLIAITGQVSSELLGRDVFQEADITGSAEPFTKYSYLVKNVKDIPRVFKEAFYIASTGRQGPVLIDVPIDIQNQVLEFEYPKDVNIRGYKPTVKGHAVQVKKVAKAIKEAKKPLLCVGGGVLLSKAEEKVRKLCEDYKIPVVSTMMGIGVMPSEHPLYFGMLGSNGRPYANRAVHESDLLILIGARVADRAVSSPQVQFIEQSTTVIHIDVDPAEIGKNLGTTIPLVGDASHVLDQVMEQKLVGDYTQWVDELNHWRDNTVLQHEYKDGFVNPAEFIKRLSLKLDEDVIYVADVGQNQIWSASNYIVRKGKFLTTGGMGTMGYSLPAAIGAKCASPDRQVVAVCGDGSFQMCLMELATMKQHHIDVKIIVMKNTYLGLVREYQHNTYHDRYAGVSLEGSPEIGDIAHAYGIPFIKVDVMDEVDRAIEDFVSSEGSCIMECNVDPYENSKNLI